MATNLGNANTYPKLKIVGPGRVFSLSNLTTGKSVLFNLELLSDEIFSLDFSPGQRVPFSSFRGAMPGAVIRGSDLEEFYLQPGANIVQPYVDDPTAQVTLTWPELYWGFEGVVA